MSEKDLKKKIELLAPAGSFEGLKAVIAAGADAVYIGGSRYSARAFADNPPEEEMLEAIDYAHLRGVRLYLTVNTLIKEKETGDMLTFVHPYVCRGIDAVLVQDFGALQALHETYPGLPLHASTQMTITGPSGASLLKKYGVTRVVPAREMTLKELAAIGRESGLEVEAFIHGALCYCYSGQCLLSSVIGGRSGNRGRCAQPCRLLYEAEGRQGKLLSPRDLCTLDDLPALIEAGVVSFKIEGRMKQPAYAAGVVSVYRKYLDSYLKNPANYRVEEKDRQLLYDLFNREGFTDGYLTRHNGRDMMAFGWKETEGNHTEAVYETMRRLYCEKEKTLPVEGAILVKEGLPLKLSLKYGKILTEESGQLVCAARKQPVSPEDIRNQLNKTGGTGFFFQNLRVICDENIFVPLGALKAIRREAFKKLRTAILKPYVREEGVPGKLSLSCQKVSAGWEKQKLPGLYLAASCETYEQLQELLSAPSVSRIYYPVSELLRETPETRKHILEKAHERAADIMFAMPFVDRRESRFHDGGERVHDLAEELLTEGFDGALIRSLETLSSFPKNEQKKIISDASLYGWNHQAVEFIRHQGADGVTAPYELNAGELRFLDGCFDEIVVYGRIPVMISAQCTCRNVGECRGKTGFLYMTDRTGRKLLIKNECAFCYNVIYNSVPLSLLHDMPEIKKSRVGSVRLSFTDERPSEMRKIIAYFTEALTTSAKPADPTLHTRGHYVRGVE